MRCSRSFAIQPGKRKSVPLIRSHLLTGDITRCHRANLQPLNKAFPTSPTALSLNARVHLAEKSA